MTVPDYSSRHFPGSFRTGRARDELIAFATRAGVDPQNVIDFQSRGPDSVPADVRARIEAARDARGPGNAALQINPYSRIAT
jgi:hypothetical protein